MLRDLSVVLTNVNHGLGVKVDYCSCVYCVRMEECSRLVIVDLM